MAYEPSPAVTESGFIVGYQTFFIDESGPN